MVYSKLPRELFPESSGVSKPGLGYAGGVKGKGDLPYNYPYRNWAAFCQEAAKTLTGDQKVYLYSANDGEDFADYAHERILVSRPLVYPEMLDALMTHSAGLVGSPYPLEDFKDSMPNKLFEYISAGIPAIVVNAPEAKEYVEFHGIGLGVNGPSEIGDALERLKDHRVVQDRWGFTMQSELPKLVEFYREVMDTRSQRVIRQWDIPEKA
jgi:glycosyltransferase involved in cell wall biosynthesis